MSKWKDILISNYKNQYEIAYEKMVNYVCPGIEVTKCEQNEDKTINLEFKEGKYTKEEVLSRIDKFNEEIKLGENITGVEKQGSNYKLKTDKL